MRRAHGCGQRVQRQRRQYQRLDLAGLLDRAGKQQLRFPIHARHRDHGIAGVDRVIERRQAPIAEATGVGIGRRQIRLIERDLAGFRTVANEGLGGGRIVATCNRRDEHRIGAALIEMPDQIVQIMSDRVLHLLGLGHHVAAGATRCALTPGVPAQPQCKHQQQRCDRETVSRYRFLDSDDGM